MVVRKELDGPGLGARRLRRGAGLGAAAAASSQGKARAARATREATGRCAQARRGPARLGHEPQRRERIRHEPQQHAHAQSRRQSGGCPAGAEECDAKARERR